MPARMRSIAVAQLSGDGAGEGEVIGIEVEHDRVFRRDTRPPRIPMTSKRAHRLRAGLFPRAAADGTEAARDFEFCFGEHTPRSLVGVA